MFLWYTDWVCVVEGEGLEEEREVGRTLEDSQTAVSVESQLTEQACDIEGDVGVGEVRGEGGNQPREEVGRETGGLQGSVF